MAEGGIGSRVTSRTGSGSNVSPSLRREEEEDEEESFAPPVLSWLELQKEWLELHRFRYGPKNFYSSDRETDIAYGSEYEKASKLQRITHGTDGPVFKRIRKAIRALNLPTKCRCQPAKGKEQKCQRESCKLRSQLIECNSDICGMGCQNQRIQKNEFATCLRIGCRDVLGKCLLTTDNIKKDTFVIEFVGIFTTGKLSFQEEYAYPIEGIHWDEQARNKKKMIHHEWYMSSLKYGTESHFIRQPLKDETPNCKIEQWFVSDKNDDFHIRLIVVALVDIPPDQPITVFFPQHDEKKYPNTNVAQHVTNREQEEHYADLKHHKISVKKPVTQITKVLKDVKQRKELNKDVRSKCDKFREIKINKEPENSSTSSEDLSNWDEDIGTGVKTCREGMKEIKLPPGTEAHVKVDNKQNDDTMHCKYDANGLRAGEKGYNPCKVVFDDVYKFLQHVKNDHGAQKCGCKMYGCGRVFNSNKEADHHFHDRHGMKIPDQPDTNDIAPSLEYFAERVRYGRHGGREALLIFDPENTDCEATGNPKERMNEIGTLQDRLEMERFANCATTKKQQDIQKQVKSIMEIVEKYVDRQREVFEREARKKQREEQK